MRPADWLTIAAVFLGPIVAVQLTRFLDDRKDVKNRKLSIFKTLMATRAYTTSWNHVEALNRIDLEFDRNNRKEKAVLDAWKEYLDLLSNTAIPPEQWTVKRVDLIVELLQKMALVLNYDFDKTQIKNSSYIPRAHTDIESQQATIRKETIELLEGKRVLPVLLSAQPSNEQQR